ncbi:MAG: 2-oxoglutarate synthase subunit alpha [candidate division NC10 bacterium RIFCSPLOWO2_12_FULL_66_18]|nr:MAG: 2-oxoglutarate synthase subunit alpha [candidate division NC10 bacterium RIFCSPLOWO2_12_FULL_66_18]
MSTQTKSRQVKLLQGNEACAEAAIAAGCRFFAGYPISPSSEIAEHLSVRLPQVGGRFIQMEDEIAAMGAILGAAMTGAKVMTATSGPGYSLKQENIGYAVMAEIPCVIVDVMRGGPSTGLPTSPAQSDVMQARWGTHGDHPAVALAPASVREVYDETIRAFNIAERFRMPVTLLVDEIIAHMRERVELPNKGEITLWERPRPTVPPDQYLPFGDTPTGVPPMANFGEGYRYHVTGLYHDPHGLPKDSPEVVDNVIRRLMRKVELGAPDILKHEEVLLDDAALGIVAYGSSARSAKAAIRLARARGIKVGLLRPLTIWPFIEGPVADLSKQVRHIIVPEMNLGQLVLEVERVVRGRCPVHRVNRVTGEPIPPDEILAKIEELA